MIVVTQTSLYNDNGKAALFNNYLWKIKILPAGILEIRDFILIHMIRRH